MPSFRHIFKREDDDILEHIIEEGTTIEPRYYLPILPNVLINGADGMGTGFATKIMMYSPTDLKTYIVNKLKGKVKDKNIKLLPWFKGFNGTVEREGDRGVVIKGKFERVSSTKLLITELPIGVYQEAYKAILLELEAPSKEGVEPYIKDYQNASTNVRFEFELTVPRTTSYETDEQIMKKLKLVQRLKENFILWLENGKLWRFEGPEDICEYFVDERLKHYERRRQKQLEMLADEHELHTEKIKFIEYYIKHSVEISKQTKAQLEELLVKLGFKQVEALLEVKVYNLTKDQIEKLKTKIVEIEKELEYYSGTTATAIYLKDLEALDLKKLMQVQQ
jgi:DNA topoisomerase-2